MKDTVWLCIPSKRPAAECGPILQHWRDQGYQIALFCDSAPEAEDKPHDLVIVGRYRGWAASVNKLIRCVLDRDEHCNWVVTGGDDILPDPNVPALTIARQCSEHFDKESIVCSTFGVMQPTGDRWGEEDTKGNHEFEPGAGRSANDKLYCAKCGAMSDHPKHLLGAGIDRVAGSPFIGREFARRVYMGKGPFCEDYYHMFDDEELQNVATLLGCFWQRLDLTHYHAHWGRPRPGEKIGLAERMPEFLQHANTHENWTRSKTIFQRHKAAGFAEALQLLP